MDNIAGEPTVVGIYSFPKSGNTWMRAILGNAIERPDGKSGLDSIPDIYTTPIWNTPVDIVGRKTVLYKSHGKNEANTANGRDFVNDLVIYVQRHPLDVFLSHLNFVSANVTKNPHIMLPCDSVEIVIERGELDLYFGAFCVFGTLQPQFADAGSWFTNAENWHARAVADPNRVMIVRYEDMVQHGPDSLSAIAAKIGLTHAQIENGFKRAGAETRADGKFFWKQKAGHFREVLSQAMIDRFFDIYAGRIAPLGYVND